MACHGLTTQALLLAESRIFFRTSPWASFRVKYGSPGKPTFSTFVLLVISFQLPAFSSLLTIDHPSLTSSGKPPWQPHSLSLKRSGLFLHSLTTAYLILLAVKLVCLLTPAFSLTRFLFLLGTELGCSSYPPLWVAAAMWLCWAQRNADAGSIYLAWPGPNTSHRTLHAYFLLSLVIA